MVDNNDKIHYNNHSIGDDNMKKNELSIKRMSLIAIFAALMCVCAWIAVPSPFSMGTFFTLQTFAIILAGLVLSPLEAFLSSVIYILLGVAGLPVFSSFGTLYSRLFSPYGGYIIGFLFAPLLISLAKNALMRLNDSRAYKYIIYIATAIVLGILVIDIPGVIQYMIISGSDFVTSSVLAALAFMPTDILKCVLAAIAAIALEKPLEKMK
jgi:biotin transport system substrate-specific component